MEIMDEIICPQCGRPNLTEAKKCWFCQVDLQQVETDTTQETSLDNDLQSNNLKNGIPAVGKATDDKMNIPDWLRRVRELKAADNPPEEEIPDWEQQELFQDNESSDKKSKTRRKKSSSHVKIRHPKRTSTPKKTTKHKEAQDQQEKNPQPEPSDIELDNLSDDLPEGFTKI